MRGGAVLFPHHGRGCLHAGVLPVTEKARQHFILRSEQTLDKLGMTVATGLDWSD
jgi:hypothetical protein